MMITHITQLPIEIINNIMHYTSCMMKSRKKYIRLTFGNLLLTHRIFRSSIREIELLHIKYKSSFMVIRKRKIRQWVKTSPDSGYSVKKYFRDIYDVFPNGIKHGSFTRMINGKIQKIGHYVMGKRDGKWQSVQRNGNLHIIQCYVDGQKHGTREKYYDGSGIKSITNYENDIKHGKKTNYNWGGNIMSICTFKNGKKDGKKIFYGNGIITETANYVEGKLNGRYITFFKDGKICVSTKYKNDICHGIRKMYYRSGQLQTEIRYKDGQKQGFERKYYEDGLLKHKCNWKDNKLHGYEYKYNSIYILTSECKYKMGEIILKKLFHENGRISDIKIRNIRAQYDEDGKVIFFSKTGLDSNSTTCLD